MAWLEDRAADAAAIVAELAWHNPIGYTPHATGVTVQVTGIVRLVAAALQTPRGGRREVLRGHVRLLPTVAPSPDARDLFAIDGVQFTVIDEPTRTWLVAFQVQSISEHRVFGTPNRIQR